MSHKNKFLVFLFLLFSCLFTGCIRQNSSNSVPNIPKEKPSIDVETTDENEINSNDEYIDALFYDLYIGEVFESGYIYIEPFQYDRFPLYELIHFDDYSDSIRFYTIDGSNYVYESTLVSESNIYIPSIEDSSQYFWQASAGESDQYTLRYLIDVDVKKPSIGIAFMKHVISSIDFSNMGEERDYSNEEYNNAVTEIEKSNEERDELDGTLSERTIENSVVGAKQICLINIEDVSYEIRLSKYFYLGFESTANVFVIDFLDEAGNVIKTMEKSNSVVY